MNFIKKNKKELISLLIISLVCFAAYYMEVLLNGWDGLTWVGNFYWSLIFTPVLFCIWLKIFLAKSLTFKKIALFLLSYAVTFILIYTFLVFIYNLRLTGYLFFLILYNICDSELFDKLIYASIFFNSLLIFAILFFENLILSKIFNYTIIRKEKLIIFFQPAYIFIIAELSLILLYCCKVFPKMNPVDLSDSIFIFKTGTVILSAILSEGIFLIKKINR